LAAGKALQANEHNQGELQAENYAHIRKLIEWIKL
jgi:hypothetical protein